MSTTGSLGKKGWNVEKHEISYLNENPCKENPNVTYVRAVVSKRVVDLIKATRGQIWVSGGQATVWWNGRALDDTNVVKFNHQ